MSLVVLTSGIQTTLQGRPRRGYRHMGVPLSGPADPLSLALANRLVGNAPDSTGLEVTLGGFSGRFEAPVSVALTGAPGQIHVNGAPQPAHRTLHLSPGDTLILDPPAFGMRTYLAVSGGFAADEMLGSPSTYLPANLGGHHGRALRAGDGLDLLNPHRAQDAETPADLRPSFSHGWALRACIGAEHSDLDAESASRLWSETFTATRQADRMGLRLGTTPLRLSSNGRMKSVPVFPGTVQCPEGGEPILLGVDAQTTGGYPRITEIARCDHHLIGQIRPGDQVRFLRRSPNSALDALRQKTALISSWTGDTIL